MDKFDKFIIATLLIALIAVSVAFAFTYVYDEVGGDVPDWSKNYARQLDERGGTIEVYDTAGTHPMSSFTVTKTDTVKATSDGLIVYNQTSVEFYPYERIHAIYIA